MMIPTGFEEAVNARRIACECLLVSQICLLHYRLGRGFDQSEFLAGVCEIILNDHRRHWKIAGNHLPYSFFGYIPFK
jgi:hypothetical protein